MQETFLRAWRRRDDASQGRSSLPRLAVPDRDQRLPRPPGAHPPRAWPRRGAPPPHRAGSRARGALAAALPRPPARRAAPGRGGRAGGRGRRPGDDRARLPRGDPAPAAAPARRADPARRPRLVGAGDGGPARLQRRRRSTAPCSAPARRSRSTCRCAARTGARPRSRATTSASSCAATSTPTSARDADAADRAAARRTRGSRCRRTRSGSRAATRSWPLRTRRFGPGGPGEFRLVATRANRSRRRPLPAPPGDDASAPWRSTCCGSKTARSPRSPSSRCPSCSRGFGLPPELDARCCPAAARRTRGTDRACGDARDHGHWEPLAGRGSGSGWP